MKPYLYILGVLLVGGGIGFFVGQRSITIERQTDKELTSTTDAEQSIRGILNRLSEAYRLHDAMSVFRDCSESYVEVDGNSGEGRGLQKSLLVAYELFRPGQSISLNIKEIDIKVVKNTALIRANYSKTSELFDKEGISGLLGSGLWIMSRLNGKWQIQAFWYTEDTAK